MSRTLVERALVKAVEAEKIGDQEAVKKWIRVAEYADSVYDKREKEEQGG